MNGLASQSHESDGGGLRLVAYASESANPTFLSPSLPNPANPANPANPVNPVRVPDLR